MPARAVPAAACSACLVCVRGSTPTPLLQRFPSPKSRRVSMPEMNRLARGVEDAGEQNRHNKHPPPRGLTHLSSPTRRSYWPRRSSLFRRHPACRRRRRRCRRRGARERPRRGGTASFAPPSSPPGGRSTASRGTEGPSPECFARSGESVRQGSFRFAYSHGTHSCAGKRERHIRPGRCSRPAPY